MLTQDALELLGRLAVNKVSDSYSKEYEQLNFTPCAKDAGKAGPLFVTAGPSVCDTCPRQLGETVQKQ